MSKLNSQPPPQWLVKHCDELALETGSDRVRAALAAPAVHATLAAAARRVPQNFFDALAAGALGQCVRQDDGHVRTPDGTPEFHALFREWLGAAAASLDAHDLDALFELLAHLGALQLAPLAELVATRCCALLASDTHAQLLPKIAASQWNPLEIDALRYETASHVV